jgi:hypothetical protein
MSSTITNHNGKRRIKYALHLTVMLGLLFTVSTRQEAEAGRVLAADQAGWKVVGEGEGILEGKKYSFYNLDQHRYLRYGERKGFNAKWDKDPNEEMEVKRIDAGDGPIKCGEPFGLFIGKEWVTYKNDPFTQGIGLEMNGEFGKGDYKWSFSKCKEGEIVRLNQPVAWKRAEGKDPIVGCKRLFGVNLCWYSDTRKVDGKNYHEDIIPEWAQKEAKKISPF